ncbi:hypothetical protein [Arenivirga flava]|uniref:Uncharacterized protein n=1 Tax=Arenivirga flava TaxID=1930060 RepID=A0AA37UKI9_9MICO|nr:hypothetical protein [Arenivirga flava]GMA28976.1 hypothetical protein GCM10025874_22290 [Arenivirga flava]
MQPTRGMTVRRRVLLRVLAPTLALLLAMAGSVTALNGTVYGAGGFTRAYLESLGRGAVEQALGTAGVVLPEGDRALLADGVPDGPQRVRIVADEALEDGRRAVTAEYELEGEPASSRFVVERDGSRFGVFSEWRFAEPPVATVAVQVLGDYRFQAPGLSTGDPSAIGQPQPYLALVPSAYELHHRTTYLEAPQQLARVVEPGSVVAATIEPRPTEHFLGEVQGVIDEHLDSCAEQTVLFPSGCPFGTAIDDRVLDAPQWSIDAHPRITIERAEEPGVWRVPATPAAARIEAQVQSIFDGSIRELDEERAFTVAYDVLIRSDDSLLVEALY